MGGFFKGLKLARKGFVTSRKPHLVLFTYINVPIFPITSCRLFSFWSSSMSLTM